MQPFEGARNVICETITEAGDAPRPALRTTRRAPFERKEAETMAEGQRDQAEGKMDEAVGGAREKVGQLTGNEEMESKGAGQKMEGKAEGVVGDVKEAAGNIKDKLT